jgi:hypothetical protein
LVQEFINRQVTSINSDYNLSLISLKLITYC